MKRVGLYILLLLCYGTLAHAVTHLYINNTPNHTITAVPSSIVLSCDAVSAGNTLACEIFVDINGNNQIDTFDERIQYLNLVDGLGWIYDGDLTENGIPGDETGRDGYIRSTLHFGEHLRPYSPQTWLVRMTDNDHSSAVALLNWELDFAPSRVTGTIRDANTDKTLPHVLVHFRDAHYPDITRLAITDDLGEFVIQLTNGDWHVSTTHPVNKEYRPSKAQVIKVSDEQNVMLNLRLSKCDAFVEGAVQFENSSPVENITVAIQNTKTFEIFNIRTDENGHFKVGVEPGQYVVTTSQYYSRYLGNHYWPDGFYAEPAVDTLVVQKGQVIAENITFISYPVTIRGRCMLDGEPLGDVLVQGITQETTKRHQLYQTFSKLDGSYTLGIFPHNIKSIVAQKEGFIASPIAGHFDIDIKKELIPKDYDFLFTEQASLMNLSGFVYDASSKPLNNIHVVAYNIWDNSPDGHLITRTNEKGYYSFDINIEGDWQIGVFKDGANAHPDIYYKYMSLGLEYTGLNFVISKDNQILADSGQLLLSSFNLVPHFPNPFFKETIIDFVLPKSSHTQIDVLSIDGDELTTLLDHNMSSGYQKVRWDGTDDTGNIFANGVYLCRIVSKEHTTIVPITLLR